MIIRNSTQFSSCILGPAPNLILPLDLGVLVLLKTLVDHEWFRYRSPLIGSTPFPVHSVQSQSSASADWTAPRINGRPSRDYTLYRRRYESNRALLIWTLKSDCHHSDVASGFASLVCSEPWTNTINKYWIGKFTKRHWRSRYRPNHVNIIHNKLMHDYIQMPWASAIIFYIWKILRRHSLNCLPVSNEGADNKNKLLSVSMFQCIYFKLCKVILTGFIIAIHCLKLQNCVYIWVNFLIILNTHDKCINKCM